MTIKEETARPVAPELAKVMRKLKAANDRPLSETEQERLQRFEKRYQEYLSRSKLYALAFAHLEFPEGTTIVHAR